MRGIRQYDLASISLFFWLFFKLNELTEYLLDGNAETTPSKAKRKIDTVHRIAYSPLPA